jgi:peptidoglycan/LPS O-acetylase OafA/YrhL
MKMANDYRADIDGLRAVAVALVIAFHIYPVSVPGGFIGVDVFFVISGFLITGLILDQQAAGSFSIRDFYIRRARRILPALAVVIAATLIIGWFVLFPPTYEKLGLHAIASTFFFPNLVYWSEAGYFDAPSKTKPLLHLWSLGVEEQFYLVWPLLLVLLRRWKAQPTAILCALSAISLIYSSIASFYDPVAAFYSPLSRLWELGAGGILASRRVEVRHPEITSFLGLTLIIGAAFTLTSTSTFPGMLAIIPVGGTAMVIAARSWILRRRPLVALGLISYPLYLWHWPLVSFAAILDFNNDLARGVIIAASVILSWMTARYVEYPIRFGSLRPHGAAISVAATLAVSLGAFMIFAFSGLPLRYPADVLPVVLLAKQYEANDRSGRCWLDRVAGFEQYAPECRDGEILVWGDSYSGGLARGFPRPYAQFSRDGCLPVLVWSYDQCAKSNAAIVDEILRLKPRRVIMFGHWPNPLADAPFNPKLDKALQDTLNKIRHGVDDVILIGPFPYWSPNLPEVAFRFWSKNGEFADRLKVRGYYEAMDKAMGHIASSQHVCFISIFEALCNADGCLTHTPRSRSELLTWDYGHLTVEGAAYLVNKLGLTRFDAAQAK